MRVAGVRASRLDWFDERSGGHKVQGAKGTTLAPGQLRQAACRSALCASSSIASVVSGAEPYGRSLARACGQSRGRSGAGLCACYLQQIWRNCVEILRKDKKDNLRLSYA